MPGILGIAQSHLDSEIGHSLVSEMLEPLLHYPWYRSARGYAQGAALGIVSLGTPSPRPRCLKSAGDRFTLAFEGELYNADELVEKLGGFPQLEINRNNHAGIVIRTLMCWGIEGMQELSGMFQFALFDALRQELLVANDPAGFRPIYYAEKPGVLAFAHEVKALLALPWVSKAIDYQGVLSFLHHGFVIGEHTFFREIKLLPPGSMLRFQRGAVTIQRYWQPKSHAVNSTSESRRDAFEYAWQQLSRQCISPRADHGVILDRSVGARLVLAGLLQQTDSITSFVCGDKRSPRVKIAKRLLRHTACPVLYHQPEEFEEGLEKSVYLTDGLLNCLHMNFRALLPAIAETANLVYAGVSPFTLFQKLNRKGLGEIVFGQRPVARLQRVFASEDMSNYPLGLSGELQLLAPSFRQRYESEVCNFVDDFVRSSLQHGIGDAALPGLFELNAYQRRFVAMQNNLIRTVVEVRNPLLDKRLLELCAGLHATERKHLDSMIKNKIKSMMPAFGRIPFHAENVEFKTGGRSRFRRRIAGRIKYRRGKLRGRNRSNRLSSASAGHMLSTDDLIRHSDSYRDFVTSYLVHQWRDGSRIFDRRGLAKMLDHHLQEKGNHAEMIGRILTVEMWYRLFVARTTSSNSISTRDESIQLREAA